MIYGSVDRWHKEHKILLLCSSSASQLSIQHAQWFHGQSSSYIYVYPPVGMCSHYPYMCASGFVVGLSVCLCTTECSCPFRVIEYCPKPNLIRQMQRMRQWGQMCQAEHHVEWHCCCACLTLLCTAAGDLYLSAGWWFPCGHKNAASVVQRKCWSKDSNDVRHVYTQQRQAHIDAIALFGTLAIACAQLSKDSKAHCHKTLGINIVTPLKELVNKEQECLHASIHCYLSQI